jgi:hypothetical protein
MAYAYRSIGRDTVMSEDKELALETALIFVMAEIRKRGIDPDELTETVAACLLESDFRPYIGSQAVIAIEEAVDALQVV